MFIFAFRKTLLPSGEKEKLRQQVCKGGHLMVYSMDQGREAMGFELRQ